MDMTLTDVRNIIEKEWKIPFKEKNASWLIFESSDSLKKRIITLSLRSDEESGKAYGLVANVNEWPDAWHDIKTYFIMLSSEKTQDLIHFERFQELSKHTKLAFLEDLIFFLKI